MPGRRQAYLSQYGQAQQLSSTFVCLQYCQGPPKQTGGWTTPGLSEPLLGHAQQLSSTFVCLQYFQGPAEQIGDWTASGLPEPLFGHAQQLSYQIRFLVTLSSSHRRLFACSIAKGLQSKLVAGRRQAYLSRFLVTLSDERLLNAGMHMGVISSMQELRFQVSAWLCSNYSTTSVYRQAGLHAWG